VIGHPGQFTGEWAYTALSRARESTIIHLIAKRHASSASARTTHPQSPSQIPPRR